MNNNNNNNNTLMNQTLNELRNIAQVENVPFSKANKKTLTERIMHYRDNVGTLCRKDKSKLKHIAQKDGIKGYGKLNKKDLIDTILFNRRVVKPRSEELKKLTRVQIRDLARKEGLLNGVGQKKDRMINNISHHRFGIMKNKLKDIVEDIANEKYKAIKISGSFDDGYVLHRSKGVDIEKGVVTIEDYLNKKVKRHILKLTRSRNGVKNHTFPASQRFHERITCTIMNF